MGCFALERVGVEHALKQECRRWRPPVYLILAQFLAEALPALTLTS